MKRLQILTLFLVAFQLASAEDPEFKILIKFGVANMEAVECTSCWPNGIITVFGRSASIWKSESGKEINIRLLPERIDDRPRLTITPLEKNEDGEIEELESVVLDFTANEIKIVEYKGFDLTFSIEPYEKK